MHFPTTQFNLVQIVFNHFRFSNLSSPLQLSSTQPLHLLCNSHQPSPFATLPKYLQPSSTLSNLFATPCSKEEGKPKFSFMGKKTSPAKSEKLEDDDDEDTQHDDPNADYRLIRTYPLVNLKDIKVQDGMFVLTFEGKTPDLCISNQNGRQVNTFMAEAIKTCSEATACSRDSIAKDKHSNSSASELKELQPVTECPPASGSGGGGGGGMFGGTKAVLGKNKEKLMENREKLGRMDEQSGEMAAQAADFMAAVKKLQQQQQNKKWYDL